jgi:hypothetical protein
MGNHASNVKLTERDKKIIVKNSNICTDSHGKGCAEVDKNEHNRKLN